MTGKKLAWAGIDRPSGARDTHPRELFLNFFVVIAIGPASLFTSKGSEKAYEEDEDPNHQTDEQGGDSHDEDEVSIRESMVVAVMVAGVMAAWWWRWQVI